ncbi:MAG TPA: hypothetical protein VF590_21505 [Isosphaeraceae bacterium]
MSQPITGYGIRRQCDGYWEWFATVDPPPYAIAGKYLFFSPERENLVAIALEELRAGAFHRAKTQMPGMKHGEDYVLCLYYRDDSRKRELAAKYRGRASVRYRYWKTDEATRRGEYSEQFLGSLDPETRRQFTGEGG